MKHLLLAFGMMLAMCGQEPRIGPRPIPKTDSIRVRFANTAGETNAKRILTPRLVDTLLANADSSDFTRKFIWVYDTLHFLRMADSIGAGSERRWIDTFVEFDPQYIMLDLGFGWKTDSVVRAERARARR